MHEGYWIIFSNIIFQYWKTKRDMAHPEVSDKEIAGIQEKEGMAKSAEKCIVFLNLRP